MRRHGLPLDDNVGMVSHARISKSLLYTKLLGVEKIWGIDKIGRFPILERQRLR